MLTEFECSIEWPIEWLCEVIISSGPALARLWPGFGPARDDYVTGGGAALMTSRSRATPPAPIATSGNGMEQDAATWKRRN